MRVGTCDRIFRLEWCLFYVYRYHIEQNIYIHAFVNNFIKIFSTLIILLLWNQNGVYFFCSDTQQQFIEWPSLPWMHSVVAEWTAEWNHPVDAIAFDNGISQFIFILLLLRFETASHYLSRSMWVIRDKSLVAFRMLMVDQFLILAFEFNRNRIISLVFKLTWYCCGTGDCRGCDVLDLDADLREIYSSGGHATRLPVDWITK